MSATPAHAAPAQDPTLANRYGGDQRRPRRRLWTVLGAIGLLAAVALSVMVGLGTSMGRIQYKDVGYAVQDESRVSVTFQATVPDGVTAECDVTVMDEEMAPVGFRTVRLDALDADERTSPSDATQYYTVDVRTVARGVTGVVETCRDA